MENFAELVAKAVDSAAADVATAVKADERYAPLVAAVADQVIRALSAAAPAA
jgi:hypothetical protein